MTKYNKSLNEILVEEFLPSLEVNNTFTKQQFADWLEECYPGFADSTVTNWLTKMSTNSETRLNWPIRKGKDDVLFKLEKVNTFRPYNQKLDPPPIYLGSEELVTIQDIMTIEKANNHSVARDGMIALKNELEKLGVRNLKEFSKTKRNMLEFDSPDKLRIQLRVKTMTKKGWQATIKDGESNPRPEKSKFWVFIQINQNTGNKIYYIAPEHWVKKDIFDKHKEYLDRNNGKRVSGSDSNHHEIKLERVKEWESRWDLLGLNINIDEKQRPDYEDEAELSYTDREGREYLKTHLVRERSSKCVAAFKRSLKSFECSFCGFDFEKVYGEIGHGFIEAHHIVPVATAGEREVKIEDYRAVCSNCHRMIHRIYPNQIERRLK